MRRARYVPSGKYSKSFRASLRALARFRVFTPGSQVGKIYAAPRYIQRRGFVQEKEVFCHEDTQEYENYLKIHLLPSRLLVASHATALVGRDRPCFSRRQAIRMGGPAAHPTCPRRAGTLALRNPVARGRMCYGRLPSVKRGRHFATDLGWGGSMKEGCRIDRHQRIPCFPAFGELGIRACFGFRNSCFGLAREKVRECAGGADWP